MATARRQNCGACRAFRRDPMDRQERGQRRIFVLTLRSASDDQTTIRELRLILKALLRAHKLRCVDIREITETMQEAS